MLAAHGIGTVGQLMLTLAVGLHVLARTGSGGWLSVTVALGFVPYVVASGVAGMLADRHSRSAVLSWSLGIRAACAASLAVGLPLGWPVPVLVAIAAAAAFTATPAYPALAAATVRSVPDDALPAANALLTGVVNLTWMAGPGVLGLILMLGGGPRRRHGHGRGVVRGGSTAVRPGPVGPPGSGRPVVRGVVATTGRRAGGHPVPGDWPADEHRGGRQLPLRFLVVAVVLLADGTASGRWMVGPVNAALSVGGVVAVLWANRLGHRLRPSTLLVLALGTFAGSVGGLAVSPWVGSAVALAGLAGATTLLAEVTAVTLVQRATPDVLTARVFGIYDQVNVGAIAAGSLLAGPLADAIGVAPAMVLVAGGCLVAAVAVSGVARDPIHRGRHAAPRRHRRRDPARVHASRPVPVRPIEHRPESGGRQSRRPTSEVRS